MIWFEIREFQNSGLKSELLNQNDQSHLFRFQRRHHRRRIIQMNAYKEVLKEHGIDLQRNGISSALGMDDRTFVQACLIALTKVETQA